MPDPLYAKKALPLVRDNIRALLAAQKEDQKSLAQYVGKSKSWINKVLNDGRGLQLADMDKIAAFFHVETYQLLQPGIAARSERRSGERRLQTERRVGTNRTRYDRAHSDIVRATHHVINQSRGETLHGPTQASRRIPDTVVDDTTGADRLAAIVAQFERRVAALYRTIGGEDQILNDDRPSMASHRRGKSHRSAPDSPPRKPLK